MSNIDYRIETDDFGKVKIPEEAYWGSATQRAFELFEISDEQFPTDLIRAIGLQKKAAAQSNVELGLFEEKLFKPMLQAIDEIIEGKFDQHFPLPIWQTGSGTQTNMNFNEVAANRANEILGQPKGTKSPIHPNDHVNLGQSSNDSFPTAMRIAVHQNVISKLLPALTSLAEALQKKSTEFAGIVKIARTHLMDAVPVNLSQDFDTYHQQISKNIECLTDTLKRVRELPQGGTAAGSGLNSHPKFAECFVKHLCKLTKQPFSSMKIKNGGMSAHDSLLELSGQLNVVAASLTKIANDVRWGACGPRCGIGELMLPIDGLTSSSMPGKVNPTQAEAMIQVCAQVMGNHTTISIACSNGNFEFLNWNPVIIFNLLQSIRILSDVVCCFTKNCLTKLAANTTHIEGKLYNSLSLSTALNLHIGYDKAGDIAVKALKENLTLKEAALALNYLTAEEFDQWVNPVKMANPFASDD